MEFEKLREIIADVMNIDEKEIKEDSSFENDLGADSLDVFQIIMGIEILYTYLRQIEFAFLISFSYHIGFPGSEVYIFSVKAYYLGDTQT